ncbi:hypothetical protein N431DRAFT_450602 [Stipitochalara longipes BDJ]|nr:hypothetical protein N431DRAFT_450602 [Stipitochalara longipes BDJ]
MKFNVLMFMWLDDDLKVLDEVRELKHIFKVFYDFQTHLCIIPSRNPHQHVKNKLAQLYEILNSPRNLVIVYYSGHGHLMKYGKMTWSAYYSKRKPYTAIPGLRWSSLQSQLELSPANVFILLDCCEAGGSLHSSPPLPPRPSTSTYSTSRSGTTELIAASPFDTPAPGPSERSFTHALIIELKALAEEGQMFSVAELHRRVLLNIIKQRTGVKSTIERHLLYPSVSPVYVRLAGETETPSIGLMPRGVRENVALGNYYWGTGELKEKPVCKTDIGMESLIDGAEVQGIGLSSLGVGAGDGPQNSYWRIREYEEDKELEREQVLERLWVIRWRPGRWQGNFTGNMEPQNESPEVVICTERSSLRRRIGELRDFLLRVPRLKRYDL